MTWSGDPDAAVRRVAVSPGAGDSLLGDVCEAGVDAYVTADMRHHPASEHLEDGGPALVIGSHYATESPWVAMAAKRISEAARERGLNLDVCASTRVTEPWHGHLSTKEEQ
ncbi:Nif3-like dinuclear metal center hexameric protein [Nanchangia anserum]|uniref:Nif3-like dinuclear metal center hexameric protein n=1 Tax=Nanchangia anserum TaxID=2692125 RepID=UPI0030B80D80